MQDSQRVVLGHVRGTTEGRWPVRGPGGHWWGQPAGQRAVDKKTNQGFTPAQVKLSHGFSNKWRKKSNSNTEHLVVDELLLDCMHILPDLKTKIPYPT